MRVNVLGVLSVLGLLSGCVHQPDLRPPLGSEEVERMYAQNEIDCVEAPWRYCMVAAFAQFKMPNYGTEGREGLAAEIGAAAFVADDGSPNEDWFGKLRREVGKLSLGEVKLEEADSSDFGAIPKGRAAFLVLKHRDGREFFFMITPSRHGVVYGFNNNRWMRAATTP